MTKVRFPNLAVYDTDVDMTPDELCQEINSGQMMFEGPSALLYMSAQMATVVGREVVITVTPTASGDA